MAGVLSGALEMYIEPRRITGDHDAIDSSILEYRHPRCSCKPSACIITIGENHRSHVLRVCLAARWYIRWLQSFLLTLHSNNTVHLHATLPYPPHPVFLSFSRHLGRLTFISSSPEQSTSTLRISPATNPMLTCSQHLQPLYTSRWDSYALFFRCSSPRSIQFARTSLTATTLIAHRHCYLASTNLASAV